MQQITLFSHNLFWNNYIFYWSNMSLFLVKNCQSPCFIFDECFRGSLPTWTRHSTASVTGQLFEGLLQDSKRWNYCWVFIILL